jgi:hypothetical protein
MKAPNDREKAFVCQVRALEQDDHATIVAMGLPGTPALRDGETQAEWWDRYVASRGMTAKRYRELVRHLVASPHCKSCGAPNANEESGWCDGCQARNRAIRSDEELDRMLGNLFDVSTPKGKARSAETNKVRPEGVLAAKAGDRIAESARVGADRQE